MAWTRRNPRNGRLRRLFLKLCTIKVLIGRTTLVLAGYDTVNPIDTSTLLRPPLPLGSRPNAAGRPTPMTRANHPSATGAAAQCPSHLVSAQQNAIANRLSFFHAGPQSLSHFSPLT